MESRISEENRRERETGESERGQVGRRLAGKRAVVTGAGGGIGSAIARRFGEAGSRVMLVDLDASAVERIAEELQADGIEAIPFIGDITQSGAMAELARKVEERLGQLDILCHAAGISGRPFGDGPVTECSETTWRHVLDVNLTGAYIVCHHLLPHMGDGGGSVIHIASDDALAIPPPPHDTHAYIAAKGGLIALTKAMAISYAPQRIRVNAIAPGWVASPMTSDLTVDSAMQASLIARHPLGRLGRPDDIAWAAVFLASDEAAFITGTVLPVEGGATVW